MATSGVERPFNFAMERSAFGHKRQDVVTETLHRETRNFEQINPPNYGTECAW